MHMQSAVRGAIGFEGAGVNEETAARRQRPRTLRQRLQHFMRVRFWRMDIAADAWIAPTASLDRNWPRGIHVGENCVIDEWAIVLSHDYTRGLYRDTVIGPRSVIGTRAIVMPGVRIGADCRVEPGTVVSRDLVDGEHVAGHPARKVGSS